MRTKETNKEVAMEKTTVFDHRYFMFDFARQRTFVREEFSLLLDGLARLGYNGVGIYLEGAFAFRSIPGVIREGVMTYDDARFAVEEGKKRGILVFPMTNVVGHMEHFFRQERFRDLSAEAENYMQMNFADERAEAFAMRIVHEYIEAFGTSYVHIGGDEVTLAPEEKVPYAKFLAKICTNLLDEGITPAIWNDMIWWETELCEYFDRRVVIYDWNYYGHRPESPKFFKEMGFESVVVCPCDNSWDNFINHQQVSGYLKARRDIPVRQNEVEAFFEDAQEAGVYEGMLTNWENDRGANLWAQWTAFARGGLYMNGRLGAREENDYLVEDALFGRVTPYSAATRVLQNELPYQVWFGTARGALFSPPSIKKLYLHAVETKGKNESDFLGTADKVDALLDAWTPDGAFETNCYLAMRATAAMVRASGTLLCALDLHPLYFEAAKQQFDNPQKAREILEQIASAFRSAADEMRAYSSAHTAAIAPTGQTRLDLVRIDACVMTVDLIADLIEEANSELAMIPITRFERLVDFAVEGKFIIT